MTRLPDRAPCSIWAGVDGRAPAVCNDMSSIEKRYTEVAARCLADPRALRSIQRPAADSAGRGVLRTGPTLLVLLR